MNLHTVKMPTNIRLEMLIEANEFHHATARQQGSRTDLYIYRKDADGFRGFSQDCSTSSWNPEEYASCNKLISGIHVGSYGGG